jgi:hypothetical protein
MIHLDHQQEQALHDIGADTAGIRWLARAMLSIHQFVMPAHFKRWNDARIAEYRRESAGA